MSSAKQHGPSNWELPPPPPSANGWEALADTPSIAKAVSPTRNTHPSLSKLSPVPTQNNNTFSPMPSLNAAPDPGWASWGIDPAKIKKEEEQVQRPTPTYVKVQDVLSNVTRSASNHGASPPKCTYAATAPHPPPTFGYRDPALTGARPGNGSFFYSTSPLPAPSYNAHSTNYAIKLPPTTSTQQSSLHQTIPRSQFNHNINMRQPHIPGTYSTRPTFQYGKCASNVTVSATTPTMPTDFALGFTPPQLQNSTSGHVNQTSPKRTSSGETGVWKIKSPLSSRISASEKSVCNRVSSTNDDNGVQSAVEPPMDDHSNFLDNSTGADSGHASSVEVPSTILASSVVSIRPKVKLPHSEQKEQQSLCPVKQSSKSQVSDFQMNMESEQTNFKLSIPKSLSIPKALLALDFVNLVAFGGEKVKIDVSLQTRTIEFHMKGDTVDIRQHCKFLINIALHALEDACAPERCEVEDFPTRKLLGIEVLDAPEAHQTDEKHTLRSLPPASMDVASSNADPSNQNMHTNALKLLLSMSKEPTVPHATSRAMPSPVNTALTLLEPATSARSEPACTSETTAGIKLPLVGSSTTITPNDNPHVIPTPEPILVHESALYDGYRSLRDMPDFASDQVIDDGYMTTLDEEDFEDDLPQWTLLDHRERMSLIGSACWAVACIDELLPAEKDVLHFLLIGPSASQVGATSNDSTISAAAPSPRPGLVYTSGWQEAQAQVDMNDALQPRLEDWVKQLADKQTVGQRLTHLTEPTKVTSAEDRQNGHESAASPYINDDKLIIHINIPNRDPARVAILGKNNRNLRDIAIKTGAVIQLAPPLRAGQPEYEKRVQIRGQGRSVNQAMQMLKAFVVSQVPRWRFGRDVEELIDHFKAAEAKRLAASPEGAIR